MQQPSQGQQGDTLHITDYPEHQCRFQVRMLRYMEKENARLRVEVARLRQHNADMRKYYLKEIELILK